MDRLTRHIGVITVAVIAVLSALGMLWQVVHGHTVDALLAATLSLTIGLLIPSPSAQRVTVDNASDDPVPVEPA